MAAYPVLLDELEGKQRYRLRAVEGKLPPDVVVPDGLVLYLPIVGDGRGNIILDLSPFKNHGTLYGVKWIKRDWGWCLGFDGNGWVDCGAGASLDITGPITVSAWIFHSRYLDSFVLGKISPGWTSGYALYLEGTSRTYRFLIGDGGDYVFVQKIQGAGMNKWTHLTGVWNGNVELYLDSELVDSSPQDAPASTTNILSVGCRDLAGVRSLFFDGVMSEVLVYNRALSEHEIRLLYENTGPRRVFR